MYACMWQPATAPGACEQRWVHADAGGLPNCAGCTQTPAPGGARRRQQQPAPAPGAPGLRCVYADAGCSLHQRRGLYNSAACTGFSPCCTQTQVGSCFKKAATLARWRADALGLCTPRSTQRVIAATIATLRYWHRALASGVGLVAKQ